MIDQPLRNDKGEVVTNLTRIAFAPRDRLDEWLQIEADLSRRPPFRVSLREVPKNLPLLPFQPAPQVQPTPTPDETEPALSAPPMLNPAPGQSVNPSLNPASNLPPLLPTTPQAEPPLNPPGAGSEPPGMNGTPAGTPPAGSPASSVQRGP